MRVVLRGRLVSADEQERGQKGTLIRSVWMLDQEGGPPIECTVWDDDTWERVCDLVAARCEDVVECRCRVSAWRDHLRVAIDSVWLVA